MKKQSKIIFLYTLVIFGAWFCIQTAHLAIYGLSERIDKADAILILGNTVNEDGSLSARLESRVAKGLELYQNGFASRIVVSGGLGKEGYYEGTEMKKYLISKGVSADRILIDDKGDNTYLTAVNFKRIADSAGIKSVIVVSQYYHIARTRMILGKIWSGKIYHAHAQFFEWRDFYSVPRETIGYYKYLLLY